MNLKNFPSVNYEFKNDILHLITDESIFLISDVPHLIEKIANALEIS